MFSTNRCLALASLALLVLAPLSGGCATDEGPSAPDEDADDVTVDEANAALVTPGSLRLFHNLAAQQVCDSHTRLDLARSHFSTAKLEEAIGPGCGIAVVPNARTYRLRLKDTECGTRTYVGSISRQGKPFNITITDHRARTCPNRVAAKVIVEETVPGPSGPITTKKYGVEPVPAHCLALPSCDPGDTQISGSCAAGDASCYARSMCSQTISCRKSAALACPAPGTVVGCMPPVDAAFTTLCAEATRTWVQANCAGVRYTD